MEDVKLMLDATSTLAGSIDPLVRVGQNDAITEVVAKMLELVKKL